MSGAAAIVLAGGRGSRMKADIPKQYLELGGKPLLYYSLKAFEDSSVNKVVLVTGAGEEEYCRREIVERYGFQKVTEVTAGGRERFHSVCSGLSCLDGATQYVLIHDGARPFLTVGLIEDMIRAVAEYGACAAGVPSKDTIKIADDDGIVIDTPDRSHVWQVQTPQAFRLELIREAYDKLLKEENPSATDDAMAAEKLGCCSVHMVMGSYANIKITTQEDLAAAKGILEQMMP